MQIDIASRHLKLTPAIDAHIRAKLARAAKFFDSDKVFAHAVLSVEKNRQIAEINLSCGKLKFRAKEESADLYSSVDLAVGKLEKQFRKQKEISKDNRKEKLTVIEKKKSALYGKAADFDGGKNALGISAVKKLDIKEMKLAKALENMRLSKSDIYVFYNIEDDKLNIIYNSKGSLILIEPMPIALVR